MWRVFAMLLVLLADGASFGDDAPEIKVFVGKEGQRVELVTGGVMGAAAALVRLRGSGSAFDGAVIRCVVERRHNGRTLVTRHHGAGWELLQLGDGDGRVYASGGEPFAIKYDEAQSRAASAADVITERDKQVASGEVALFEKKEYPHLVKKYENKATAASAILGKSCKGAPHLRFQWSSFSDEDMDNVDVWAACQPMVTALQSQCGALRGVTELVCRMGGSLEVTRSADRMVFTTTRNGAATAGAFLSTHLGK